MKKVISYVAFDGTKFESEGECISYERKIIEEQYAKRLQDAFYDYCDNVYCKDCALKGKFCDLGSILEEN